MLMMHTPRQSMRQKLRTLSATWFCCRRLETNALFQGILVVSCAPQASTRAPRENAFAFAVPVTVLSRSGKTPGASSADIRSLMQAHSVFVLLEPPPKAPTLLPTIGSQPWKRSIVGSIPSLVDRLHVSCRTFAKIERFFKVDGRHCQDA